MIENLLMGTLLFIRTPRGNAVPPQGKTVTPGGKTELLRPQESSPKPNTHRHFTHIHGLRKSETDSISTIVQRHMPFGDAKADIFGAGGILLIN